MKNPLKNNILLNVAILIAGQLALGVSLRLIFNESSDRYTAYAGVFVLAMSTFALGVVSGRISLRYFANQIKTGGSNA